MPAKNSGTVSTKQLIASCTTGGPNAHWPWLTASAYPTSRLTNNPT